MLAIFLKLLPSVLWKHLEQDISVYFYMLSSTAFLDLFILVCVVDVMYLSDVFPSFIS